MITEQEYLKAKEYLRNVNKENISADAPIWKIYKNAIEVKVDYETQQKEKK